jgi:hypothetical protein
MFNTQLLLTLVSSRNNYEFFQIKSGNRYSLRRSFIPQFEKKFFILLMLINATVSMFMYVQNNFKTGQKHCNSYKWLFRTKNRSNYYTVGLEKEVVELFE